MNKKFILIIAMLAMYILPAGAWIRTSHFIQFWGEAGAQQYTGDIVDGNIRLGFMGDVGLGYEFRANAFVINTGVGFAVPHFRISMDDVTSQFYGYDDEGDGRYYNYVQTNRSDGYTSFNVQIPLMLGVQLKRFYGLIGVKGDFSIWSYSRTKAMMAAQGVYDEFIDPFANMPEHTYYSGTPLKQRQGLRFKPNMLASIEIGWRLGNPTLASGFDVNKSQWQYRLGFFFDYGVFNFAPTPSLLNLVELPKNTSSSLADISLNNVIATTGYCNKLKDFTIGFKFTALFHVTKWWNCVVCEDLSPRIKPQKNGLNWKW